MNRARKVAYCGVCSAISLMCLVLGGFLPYVTFMCWVVASMFTAVPILVFDQNGGAYSILSCLASGILAFVICGVGNLLHVLPFVTFCAPFALIKTEAEKQIPLSSEKPIKVFDEAEPKIKTKNKIKKPLKWVVYYLLMEVTLGLEILVMYLTVPQTLEKLSENYLLYVGIALLNAFVPVYDFLISGCVRLTEKTAKKALKL